MINFIGSKFYLYNCNSIGRICHMDYSENLSQQYKFEPQSCHFNNSQYSLHCTVKHTGCDTSPYECLSSARWDEAWFHLHFYCCSSFFGGWQTIYHLL